MTYTNAKSVNELNKMIEKPNNNPFGEERPYWKIRIESINKIYSLAINELDVVRQFTLMELYLELKEDFINGFDYEECFGELIRPLFIH